MNDGNTTIMLDAGEGFDASPVISSSNFRANIIPTHDSSFEKKFTVGELVEYIIMGVVAATFVFLAFNNFKDDCSL
ncbi:hypothetical protein BJ138DRAFT_1118635 [Hygrophoropsis aurantiaca]|uniref:Uncharacterized protein n=1 Tax=Hygrophoropsis aurantiaca TaxID=72124 RepID=A0ACB7ZX19_9AGAM|nr:hypothetical protein BJ138DRAFT_1118635 [Hygrophoropsis aurantiaca]